MAKKYCTDIWSFFNLDRTPFMNPFYHIHHSAALTATTNVTTSSNDPHKLFLPPLGQILRGVSLWGDYFLRWSTVSSVPPIPSYLSHVIYHPVTVLNDPSEDITIPPAQTEALQLFPELRLADCTLYPLVQSSDSWEAMYLQEKHAKESLVASVDTLQTKTQVCKQLFVVGFRCYLIFLLLCC